MNALSSLIPCIPPIYTNPHTLPLFKTSILSSLQNTGPRETKPISSPPPPPSSSCSCCRCCEMLVAPDVTSMVRMMERYEDKEEEGKSDLVTMDLLGGGCAVVGTKELDLDLKVPLGWEKRLDLVSGEVFFHCSSSSSGSSSNAINNFNNSKANNTEQIRRLQDLNFKPNPTSTIPPPPPNLDLKLFSATTTSHSTEYQSVCTLDKVKFALDRIKKPHQQQNGTSSSLTSSSTTTSSTRKKRRRDGEEDSESRSASGEKELEGSGLPRLQAAGCPSCLSYVLIAKGNPRCPRCNSAVPVPVVKKPRIDLNSFSSASALAEFS